MTPGHRAIVRSLLVAAVWAISSWPSLGAEGAPSGHESIQFRRYFAPANRVDEWPRDDVHYLPIDEKEFEELLTAAAAARSEGPAPRAARLASAEYRAQLQEGDVLTGTAVLEVTQAVTTENLLPLEPCSLAIHAARWTDESLGPVTIGTGPSNRVALLVRHSGELRLDWSLRGERASSGSLNFRFDLPVCPAGRLVLDAPANMAISADHGVVEEARGARRGFRRWTIELGGQHRLTVRAVNLDDATNHEASTSLRQGTTYEFSTRGLDVTARLRLDAHQEPISRIAIELDAPLRLTGARHGDTDLQWFTAVDSGGTFSRAVVEFPAPLTGANHVIRLTAVGPLTDERHFRLPAIHVSDVLWEEGTATLVVPAPLVLAEARGNGCQQSKTAIADKPAEAESLEFQCFRADASIDVAIDRPQGRVRIDSGSQLEIGPSEIVCSSALTLAAKIGEQFGFSADLSPKWRLDAVEIQEGENSADWSVVAGESGVERLEVRFSKPITPERSVRLLISGRRPSALGEPLSANDLRMLSTLQAPVSRGLIAIQAADACETRLSGNNHWSRLDSARMSNSDRRLFPKAPAGLLFVADSNVAGPEVTVVERRPSYMADIRIDALAQGNTLTETCVIRWTPDGGRVNRLLILFSHAVEEPWRWTDGEVGVVAARRLSRMEATAAGVPSDAEAWEINLRATGAESHEIRATRTVPFTGRREVSLASLPEAASQRGAVALGALGAAPLSIESTKLKPIPAEPSTPESIQTTQAVFRYEPATDLAVGDTLSIAPADPQPAIASAWVWNCHLDSRYSPGLAAHLATLDIETAGASRIRVQLPAGASLKTAWIDATELPKEHVETLKKEFTITLPAGNRRACVALYYFTSEGLSRWSRSVGAPLPELDVPVLHRLWTIWTPVGFSVADATMASGEETVAPSWRDRLFGALASSARQRTLDFFNKEYWFEGGGRLSGRDRARDALNRFQAAIDDLEFASGMDGRPVWRPSTWSELLDRCERATAVPRLKLLVDATALARAGVGPDSPIMPLTYGVGPVPRASDVLTRAGFTLLATEDTILLTTDVVAAERHAELGPPEGIGSRSVLSGELADSLASAANVDESPPFLTVAAWRNDPDLDSAPTAPVYEVGSGLVAGQWTATTLEIANSGQPTARLVHVRGVAAVSWAIALSVIFIGVWQGGKYPRMWLLFTGVALSAALLAPAPMIPLTSATFTGALIAVAWGIAGRSAHLLAPRPASDVSSKLTRLTQAVAVLAAVSVAWVLNASHADEIDKKPIMADSPAPLHKVFVPIDTDGRPTGGRCHVPEPLYNELRRRANAGAEQPTDWLLSRAVYRGELSRDVSQKALIVRELKAAFDLQTFQRNVTVHVPIGGASMRLVAKSVALDGERIDAQSTAKEIAFVVAEPGLRRLELTLALVAEASDTSDGLAMTIPRLPTARLELVLAADAPPVEIPEAQGRVDVDSERRRLTAELGSTDRLLMRWPDGGNAATPNLDVEELYWLKGQGGSVTLSAKLKFHLNDSRLHSLRLHADPRLRLTPPAAEDSLISSIRVTPGDPATIEIDLSRPVADQLTLDLEFLVTDATGVGNLRLPRLEPIGARSTRRWLAVTLDPGLEAREATGEHFSVTPIAEFMAAWNGTESKPQLAYSLATHAASWTLATQPRAAESSVDDVMSIGVGRGAAALVYEATISTISGRRLQIGLETPPRFEIESLSVLEEGVERASRFARSSENLVTVFLSEPIGGQALLIARGRMPLAAEKTVIMPRLRVSGATTTKSQIRVYRAPGAIVEVLPSADFEALGAESADKGHSDLGSLVGCYQEKKPAAEMILSVAPNAPTIDVAQVTTLRREGDNWLADVDCQFEVSGGLVDSLTFDIPGYWTEPFQIDHSATSEVISAPGESRRRLVVRPAAPIQGVYRVKITGRVATTGDRMRVPEIMPLGASRVSRYVALPKQLELQPVVWRTQGLKPAPLPSWESEGASDAVATYEVSSDQFSATFQSIEHGGAAPHAQLADVAIFAQADGAYRGWVSYDFEPDGADHCDVRLPAECRFVHARVGGIPALSAVQGEGCWRLRLNSRELPDRIEIVYTGQTSAGSKKRFAAPELVDFAVDRTLWTISDPVVGGASNAPNGQSITAAEQELHRCQSVLELLELPPDVVAEQPPEDLARWGRAWKARWRQARGRLEWRLNASGRPRQIDEAEIREIDERAERLGAVSQDSTDAAGSDGMRLASSRAFMVTRWKAPGASVAISVEYPQSPNASVWPRWLLAVVIAALTLAAFRRVRSTDWPRLAPSTIALSVGGVWWLCLSPPVVGLAILGASLLARLHRHWRQRQLGDSTNAYRPNRAPSVG